MNILRRKSDCASGGNKKTTRQYLPLSHGDSGSSPAQRRIYIISSTCDLQMMQYWEKIGTSVDLKRRHSLGKCHESSPRSLAPKVSLSGNSTGTSRATWKFPGRNKRNFGVYWILWCESAVGLRGYSFWCPRQVNGRNFTNLNSLNYEYDLHRKLDSFISWELAVSLKSRKVFFFRVGVF